METTNNVHPDLIVKKVLEKMQEPVVMVNGYRKLKYQPLPEDDVEDVPMTPQEELDLALLDAVCDSDRRRAECLLRAGANLWYRTRGGGETALHFAACRGDIDMVRWILLKKEEEQQSGKKKKKTTTSSSSSWRREGECEYSALHWAAMMGHADIVKELLERGEVEEGQVQKKSHTLVTPLWLMQNTGHEVLTRDKQSEESIKKMLQDQTPTTNVFFRRGPVVLGKKE